MLCKRHKVPSEQINELTNSCSTMLRKRHKVPSEQVNEFRLLDNLIM